MKRLLLHPLGIIILTTISLSIFFSLEKTISQHQLSEEQVKELKTQTSQLETQITTLETEVQQASQAAYQEKMLRDELLMQKDGEYIVKIEYNQSSGEETSTTPEPTPWQEWKNLIF
jgi:cell division protein FtsB